MDNEAKEATYSLTYSVQNNEHDYLDYGHASFNEHVGSWTYTIVPQRNMVC